MSDRVNNTFKLEERPGDYLFNLEFSIHTFWDDKSATNI